MKRLFTLILTLSILASLGICEAAGLGRGYGRFVDGNGVENYRFVDNDADGICDNCRFIDADENRASDTDTGCRNGIGNGYGHGRRYGRGNGRGCGYGNGRGNGFRGGQGHNGNASHGSF